MKPRMCLLEATSLLLLVVAIVALVPARRTAALDPVKVLASE